VAHWWWTRAVQLPSTLDATNGDKQARQRRHKSRATSSPHCPIHSLSPSPLKTFCSGRVMPKFSQNSWFLFQPSAAFRSFGCGGPPTIYNHHCPTYHHCPTTTLQTTHIVPHLADPSLSLRAPHVTQEAKGGQRGSAHLSPHPGSDFQGGQ